MKIPNVNRLVELPQDFVGHVVRLGYTVEELVWLLAADLCYREPQAITWRIGANGPKRTGRPARLANLIPFHR